MKYAEFCTGIGGFRLGLEATGHDLQLVYSNEIDDSCEKTYKLNFGSEFDSKDIFSINSSELPEFDMICAGFPCQPFSVAGKELGFSDIRGGIFFKLYDIIRTKQPSIVFLENVPNLVHHDKGNTFRTIISSLEAIGYSISWTVLDSSLFGIPQSRSRVYIIGLLKSRFGDKKINFTKGTTDRRPLREFLVEGDYSIPITKKWEEYIDYYTGLKTEAQLSFPLPRTRRKLERISSDCDLMDCVFQVRSSGVRALSIDHPFPTFTVLNSGGGAHIPILSKERRHLSILEIKRIMGFPDAYDFSAVSKTDAAKQLANAVCPPVITSIYNDIMNAIEEN